MRLVRARAPRGGRRSPCAPRWRLTRAALAAVLASCASPSEPSGGRPAVSLQTAATEQDAVAISSNIQQLHMPYGTVIDPVFASGDAASPDFTRLTSYSRAGDAAIWTGHYLAAEAFRYQVTRSSDALSNARRALDGLTALVDVTGTDLLARFLIPTSSPYVADITAGEARHGRYQGTIRGQSYYWWGNTSRDQYSGAFFGLAVAYDMIDDARVRGQVRKTVTRMLDFLLRNGWNVVMPDGSISTTFNQRPDQQLSFLQVGRRVNPDRYAALYTTYRASLAATVALPMQAECMDEHGSYYKFNLDYINLYDLVRLEEATSPYRAAYLTAYGTLRGCTAAHQNAHFNMIDRGLAGADASRDADTRQFLALWLERPRRDYYVDVLTAYPGKYTACGDRTCEPVAVNERPNTDFLWQRSPFGLRGGGAGTIETAAVDYILPYWMARYYGVLAS